MKIAIRRATVDDLPWIRYLVDAFRKDPSQAFAYPVFDDEELDRFTLGCLRALELNPRFSVWLAWKGKRAIGCVGGEVQERPVGKPRIYVNALWQYVAPEHRHGDVGFRLAEALGGWATSLGAVIMEAKAAPGDTRYQDAGYAVVTTGYAAPIAEVLDRWRGKVYPLPASTQVEPKTATG